MNVAVLFNGVEREIAFDLSMMIVIHDIATGA